MFEIYNGRKVLVTGHTGFKGSWLTATLRFLKAKVGGFALAPNTDPSHYLLLNFENISSTLNNIKNREALEESVYNFQPEIIFHLAAQPLVRESYLNPVETYQTNVIGTLNLLEAARRCDSVRAVVIITTDKVYENKEWIFPYREVDELGGHDMYSS